MENQEKEGQAIKSGRPELIAYSEGFNIIPFENVRFVELGWREDGNIEVHMDQKNDKYIELEGQQAKDFIKQYNNYLAFVEAATITQIGDGNV